MAECPKCNSKSTKVIWETDSQIGMNCVDCHWAWLQPLVDPLFSMGSDEDLYPPGAPYTADLLDDDEFGSQEILSNA